MKTTRTGTISSNGSTASCRKQKHFAMLGRLFPIISISRLNRRRTAEHSNAAASNRIRGKFQSRLRRDCQDVDKVLCLFDDHRQRARRQYAKFVGKGVSEGRKPELVGGGLIGCFKPGAIRPVSTATIKAQMCFCLYPPLA